MPLHQSSILQERDSGTTRILSMRWSQGCDLEGAVSAAHDVKQGLRVGRVGITDDGDHSRIRAGANAAFDEGRSRLLGPMVFKTDLIVDLT